MTTVFVAQPAGQVRHARIDSPIGDLTLLADDAALLKVCFEGAVEPMAGAWGPRAELAQHPVLGAAAAQLSEYFAGERTAFTLPLRPGGTPFQEAAWQALIGIPYGQTRSYAAQAVALGRPTAVRAVGGANNRNPLPIVIPCHRVLGASGALTGYAGGLPVKEFLLRLEGVLL